MPTTHHRPLKIIAFNANGIGMQAYGVRKLSQNFQIDVALFSETHPKPHIGFYIPNFDIYRTDGQDGSKDGIAVAVKKGIHHTCA
jgi:exonuclease III